MPSSVRIKFNEDSESSWFLLVHDDGHGRVAGRIEDKDGNLRKTDSFGFNREAQVRLVRWLISNIEGE